MSETKPRRQPFAMFGLGQRCCDWRIQPETTFCGTFTTDAADVELLREIDMSGNQALYGVGVPAPKPVAPDEGWLEPGEIVEERQEGYVMSQYKREEMKHRHTDDFLRDGVWSHCVDAEDALVVFRRGFTAENGAWKRGAEPERRWRTYRATFENVVGGDGEGAFWGDVETTSSLSMRTQSLKFYLRHTATATRRFEIPLAASVFRVGSSGDSAFPLGLATVETSTPTATTDFELDSDALPPFEAGSSVYRAPPETLSVKFGSKTVAFNRVTIASVALQVEETPSFASQEIFADGVRYADARIVGTARAQIIFDSTGAGNYSRGDSLDPADYAFTPTVEEVKATLDGWAAPWIATLFDAGRRNLEARWSVAVERFDMTIGDANGEPFPDDAIAAEVRARLETQEK